MFEEKENKLLNIVAGEIAASDDSSCSTSVMAHAQDAFEDKIKTNRMKRLDYLLKQTEIYAHFMSNSSQTQTPQKNKRKRLRKSYNNNNDHEGDEEYAEPDVHNESLKDIKQFTKSPDYIEGGEMRDYQLCGLNWLISLYEHGINGILADEMGLGKTLQSISLLGFLKHYKKISGPHLIVVPNSTLLNWEKEVKHWCPSLQAVILIGEKKKRKDFLERTLLPGKWNVCITTYEMILKECSTLKRFNWHYIIMDEGHRIKNAKTKLSCIIRQFICTNRLLITGTPLHNDLHELWCLLNFLLPDVFNSSEDFDQWFNKDAFLGKEGAVGDNHDALVKRLHSILKPFLLRRLKCDVEKSLQPKKEVKIYVGLSDMQRELYKKLLLKDLTYTDSYGMEKRVRLENMLMQLRKCACHPYLFENQEPGPPYTTGSHIVDNAGKMVVLDKLLPKLRQQDSRVLIFCQFLQMLTVLEDYLTWRGYEYCRLDGSISNNERQELIEEFNKPKTTKFVFLLSTRAGGLGINLYTADVVIFYDSDWNPQMDLQAMDRAHRIGQKKQVRVFRLITEHTIEEKIDDCAEMKLRLDRVVIQQQGASKGPTKNELMSIIRFGANEIFSNRQSQLSDEDIDRILERGEKKTIAKTALLNNLFESDAGTTKNAIAAVGALDKRQYYDFQFYPKRFHDLLALGRSLSTKEEQERVELRALGFAGWDTLDFQKFVTASEKFGRNNLRAITDFIDGKSINEVMAYHNVFWMRCNEVKDYRTIIKHIEEGEKVLKREPGLQELLGCKLSRYRDPLRQLRFDYSRLDTENNRNLRNINQGLPAPNTESLCEDRFLIYTLWKIGAERPGVYNELLKEIGRSNIIKSSSLLRQISILDLKQRCEMLISTIRSEWRDRQEEELAAYCSDLPAYKRLK